MLRRRMITWPLLLALSVCSPVSGMEQSLTAAQQSGSGRDGNEGPRDMSDAPDRTFINYEGHLQAGLTYRAKVRGDKVFDLLLVPPLKPLIHQSVGVDWTNLDEFPALKRLRRNAREREIIFKVLSDKTTYMSGRRWSRTLLCKIIAVE